MFAAVGAEKSVAVYDRRKFSGPVTLSYTARQSLTGIQFNTSGSSLVVNGQDCECAFLSAWKPPERPGFVNKGMRRKREEGENNNADGENNDSTNETKAAPPPQTTANNGGIGSNHKLVSFAFRADSRFMGLQRAQGADVYASMTSLGTIYAFGI
jgi:hypothetical protein